MRFLRGLGTGAICFFVWVVVSFLSAMWVIGEYGLFSDVDPTLPLIFSIPMTLSFFGMLIGPIYYWIAEPLWIRYKNKPKICQICKHPITVGIYCPQCGTRS